MQVNTQPNAMTQYNPSVTQKRIFASADTAAFRDRLLVKTVIAFKPGEKPTGRYTDRVGRTIECVFDGPDKLDGDTVDYSQWPVLENPWMRQSLADGPLTVTGAPRSWRYDFQEGRRMVATEDFK